MPELGSSQQSCGLTMFLAWVLNLYVQFRDEYENMVLGTSMGRIKWLPFGCLLKYSRDNIAAESDTLKFIRQHTTIPVPRVYAAATGYGRNFMVMECMKGTPLEYMWKELNAEQRANVVSQLRDYVRQLRTLKKPPSVAPGMVSSLYGKAWRDNRLASVIPIGPFANLAAFNDRVEQVAQRWIDPTFTARTRAKMRDDSPIVFTHGDLAPRNILVDGGTVTAVVDWEEAGWFPEHWELVKAMWCTGIENDSTWNDAVLEIMPKGLVDDWKTDQEFTDRMVGAF